MDKKVKIKKPLTFEWDKGNVDKNVNKHNVQNRETEEIFFNDPIILTDWTHSQVEERYFAFGETDEGRSLLVSYTLRGEKKDLIRPIMSRDQNNKEKTYYLEQKKEVKKQK